MACKYSFLPAAWRRVLSVVALLALVSVQVLAVPALPRPFRFRLPDGTSLWLTLRGDEAFHFYLTADGFPLQASSDGLLHFLTLADGVPVVSDRTLLSAHDVQRHAEWLQTVPKADLLQALGERAEAARAQFRPRPNGPKRAAISSMISEYPTIGSPNQLVLLVEFEDLPFMTPNPHEAFDSLMNVQGYNFNGATGSALDYFTAQSRGLFTPRFCVYGPLRLPHPMAYYGAPTANAYDCAPWQMVADACTMLHEQHPELDFSAFDNDQDGMVDNVFLFYAGYGQNSGAPVNTIWPHAAELSWYGLAPTFNNVVVSSYACTNEIQGTEGAVRTGIGTFCHEFSHVLGLPDFYATQGYTAFTPGQFSLMDTGPYLNAGNTPPAMSSFERYALRWLNPRQLSGPETLTLEPLTAGGEALLIPTMSQDEFFLLENRQKSGWDAFLPGHGLLVWHIDYQKEAWEGNTVNNSASHQRVDLVEADALLTEESRAGDPFPGRSHVTEFTDDTTPSMTAWTGVRTAFPLTDIREIDSLVAFKVKGGGETLAPPVAQSAADVSPVSFKACWEGVAAVGTYEVDICRGAEVVPFRTLTKEIASLADCWVLVADLEPLTTYTYVVRCLDGERRSADSNRITASTLAPTFDMLTPTPLAPTDIASDAFCARWSPMQAADAYCLSIYIKEYTALHETSCAFESLSALPDGWQTTSTSTSSLAGTYGTARPSLAFKENGDEIAIASPSAPIRSLSLWAKASAAAEGVLYVEFTANGTAAISTEIPLSKIHDGTTLDCLPPAGTDCRAARIWVALTAGTVYIDDVLLATGGEEVRIHDARYPSADAADACWMEVYAENADADACWMEVYAENADADAICHQVDGLQSGATYFYTVTARNGATLSRTSDEVQVDLLTPDGIRPPTHPVGDALSPISAPAYDVQGRRTRIPRGVYIQNGRKVVR